MLRGALAVAVVALLVGCTSAKLYGVTYNPFSKSDKQQCLAPKDMAGHLASIGKNSKNIRLYSLSSCPENTIGIMKFAKKNKIGVMLGMYLRKGVNKNRKEFQMLTKLVKDYPKVISAIVVGDELVYIRKFKPALVVSHILMAKAIVKKARANIPVSTAESWPFLEFNKAAKKIARVVDFMCMNMHPYWEGVAASSSPGTLVNSKADVLENVHKKEVVVCATGWPTMGEKCCSGRPMTLDGRQSIPAVKLQSNFFADLAKAAGKSKRKYYISEAVDAEWKRVWAPCTDCKGLTKEFGCGNKKNPECEVDYHFGIMDYSGKMKKGVKIP